MQKNLLAIPVFNEKANLPDVLSSLLVSLSDIDTVLFINDGSTDSSSEILNDFIRTRSEQSCPKMVIIEHSRNLGYGYVLNEAFQFGMKQNFHYLITMDCDRQHEARDIQRFLATDPEADIVSGTRYSPLSQSSGNAPKDRVEINNRITSRLNSLFQWNISDSFCGFKRYTLSCFRHIDFHENGYSFPLELWVYAAKKNLKIVELPVSRIYTTDDRSFGEDLDKRRKRYRYYLLTLKKAFSRFFEADEL